MKLKLKVIRKYRIEFNREEMDTIVTALSTMGKEMAFDNQGVRAANLATDIVQAWTKRDLEDHANST